MVFISRLKLRNFKSFKIADIQLPKTFICFAGPNGSGKSNLCDAIRFAMGETSLRSLRAKKVKDLIHTGSKTAEVAIIFDHENGDGQAYEIKRAIREDGKIKYRLNGKKTTRSTILETLKRHSLDQSGRNTIAQGEVQRIINMNGKERRTIIDSVAGIADFEEKKREALHELQTVEDRIREARVVLGERKAYLDELGREKDTAIKYTDAKKMLTNAKGTLLKTEIEKLERDLEEASKNEERILSAKSGRDKEIADIEASIAEVDAGRAKTSEEMQSKQKTSLLVRRLEELKASIGARKQFIEDREGSIKGIKDETDGLAEEIAKEKADIAALEKELTSMQSEFHRAEQDLAAAGGFIENAEIANLRKMLEEHEKALAGARERLVFIESETDAKRQLITAKKEEERGIASKGLANEYGQEEDDPTILRRDIEKLAREIDQSFKRTKEINGQMAELDREMLELKEKASIYKIRSSPQLANPAIGFVSELMKDKGSGIYGTVADLISFDPKYSSAVEAAGGSRLLYVVVDGVDTATEVIDKLKKAKSGRATFIPLDSIRTPPPAKANGFSSVLEKIEFKDHIRRAVEYVFADTLLLDSVADAKKLGVGSARMVTLDGEIFERSGIVSGGRTQSGLLSANQLRKIENELNDVKSTKDSMMQELYSIREEESRLRAEKSQLEIKLKTFEMKQRIDDERRKEHEQAYKRKEQLAQEIVKLEQAVSERLAEKSKLSTTLVELETNVVETRKHLGEAETEFRKLSEESSKKRADKSAAVSSIRAKIDGRTSEISLRTKECNAKDERLKKLHTEEKTAHERISEARKQIKIEETELSQLEDQISSASKEIEKLFARMKSYEEQLQELGKKRGQVRIELDKFNKDLNQTSIKKATTVTRLEDMKTEFSSYADAEFLKHSKEELNRLVAQSETVLAGLGNVNMAAIEMFDKKKAEIDGVEEKIGKLDTEREAILSMISEIDEHKKDAFFETFNAVSENFSNMFKHINVGQGHLYLNDPANPFESGLFIKLRRNNQEHSLDALSGGEKTLVALMFICAMQLFKPAPFYILDEVDAALDKPNSKNLADLVAKMSGDSLFIIVTHNDNVMSHAESVIGVTKADDVSKLVGIKLKQAVTQT